VDFRERVPRQIAMPFVFHSKVSDHSARCRVKNVSRYINGSLDMSLRARQRSASAFLG
jgi:hypothetical protein